MAAGSRVRRRCSPSWPGIRARSCSRPGRRRSATRWARSTSSCSREVGGWTSRARGPSLNRGFEYREQVGAEGDGVGVARFLASRYAHSTEAVWRERIAAGEVSVGGRPVEGNRTLRAGETLAWRRPPWDEPDVPLAFAVLYRDESLLALAKPCGLPSVPAGGFLTHTLLHLARIHFPAATPMHRLGRGTSGVVLFALTAKARSTLARSWRAGEVEKTYRALV